MKYLSHFLESEELCVSLASAQNVSSFSNSSARLNYSLFVFRQIILVGRHRNDCIELPAGVRRASRFDHQPKERILSQRAKLC
jgi:hypothetical protein